MGFSLNFSWFRVREIITRIGTFFFFFYAEPSYLSSTASAPQPAGSSCSSYYKLRSSRASPLQDGLLSVSFCASLSPTVVLWEFLQQESSLGLFLLFAQYLTEQRQRNPIRAAVQKWEYICICCSCRAILSRILCAMPWLSWRSPPEAGRTGTAGGSFGRKRRGPGEKGTMSSGLG